MEDASDDRGSLRERLSALEAEVTRARATLEELQRGCAEKKQRAARLEERLALLEDEARQVRSPRAKLFLGLLLLPFAALGGAFSGVTAGLPFEIAGLALRLEGDSWPLATTLPFVLVGTLSALTLAMRWMRRT